jgi:hypothetical protein
MEPMLLMRNLTDRNQKFAGIPAANPVNMKHVPQVTVGPLIERPREPDAGLDGHDTA